MCYVLERSSNKKLFSYLSCMFLGRSFWTLMYLFNVYQNYVFYKIRTSVIYLWLSS